MFLINKTLFIICRFEPSALVSADCVNEQERVIFIKVGQGDEMGCKDQGWTRITIGDRRPPIKLKINGQFSSGMCDNAPAERENQAESEEALSSS